MTRRRIRREFAAALLLIAPPAAAQSRQFLSVQGSGLLTSLQGNAFDLLRIGTGLGGEFQVRINPGSVSYGLGYQITMHSSTSQGLAQSHDAERRVLRAALCHRDFEPSGPARMSPAGSR